MGVSDEANFAEAALTLSAIALQFARTCLNRNMPSIQYQDKNVNTGIDNLEIQDPRVWVTLTIKRYPSYRTKRSATTCTHLNKGKVCVYVCKCGVSVTVPNLILEVSERGVSNSSTKLNFSICRTITAETDIDYPV